MDAGCPLPLRKSRPNPTWTDLHGSAGADSEAGPAYGLPALFPSGKSTGPDRFLF